MTKILIISGDLAFDAELNQSPTALAIAENLPIESLANVWGEEIYFEIPISMPIEFEAREIMELGELAYWPVGRAFCIFFGPTPVSTDERPRAYSPVNVVGRVKGDTAGFKSVKNGASVKIQFAGN
ncbi:MAG: cyclophilin-like fold protein [Anaerolineales bacterium]